VTPVAAVRTRRNTNHAEEDRPILLARATSST